MRFIQKYWFIWFLLFITFFLISIGVGMNMAVMKDNCGRMPVKADYKLDTCNHFNYSNEKEVKNVWFADNYEIGGTIWSIGDFFLLTGVGINVFTIGFIIGIAILKMNDIYKRGTRKGGTSSAMSTV